ncbi:MAG: hypothetical protein ABW203_03500 [Novosphingobium sp.]
MRLVLTALIFLAGLFDLFLGVGFLVEPVGSGTTFFLEARGNGGLAVLRADMTAFFVVAAGCMIWGAWRRNGDLLLVPAVLFGIAFTGRLVSRVFDGGYPLFWVPMAVEAVHVVLLAVAWRMLPHHRIREIAG